MRKPRGSWVGSENEMGPSQNFFLHCDGARTGPFGWLEEEKESGRASWHSVRSDPLDANTDEDEGPISFK